MKRTLRKPEDRVSTKRNDFYYESDELYNYDEFYNAEKRTKQDPQPRKENRMENKKVQQPKKLGKTLREENEKNKGIIENLKEQLAKHKIENAYVKAEMELLQEENLKIQIENEKRKGIIELENHKIKSEHEKNKGIIKALEEELKKYKIESGNAQTENEEVVKKLCAVNMGASVAEMIATDELLKCIPITESIFTVWDISLKESNLFLTMMNFYLSINLKNENAFVSSCIKKTFSEDFIQTIHFDSSSKFNNSNILLCLIRSFIEKFKDSKYDEIQSRSKIVAGFLRFRNAACKRNARKK